MKHEFRGFDKVFAFTFRQYWKGKGFLRATVITAALCLLLPALILPLVELIGSDGSGSAEAFTYALERVYVVDESESEALDVSVLGALGAATPFAGVEYLACTAEEALRLTGSDAEKTLVLHIDDQDGGYAFGVLTPKKSDLDSLEVMIFTDFINGSLPVLTAIKLGADPARVASLYAPTVLAAHNGTLNESMTEETPDEEAVTPQEQARQVLAIVLPYFNIMILYFMVLFYGQGVANSVVLEKTSKLIDTFLVTVRPTALVMGKLFAITLSGALQLLCWLASLLGGFVIGTGVVRWISPESQMGLLVLIDQIDLWGGLFSLPAMLIAVLMLSGGFLLYCSLAAIGGSMASKPEELSSTNTLFSMVLVISFMCTIYGGGLAEGEMSSSATWLNWVPFTSILIAPSRVLIGELSIGGALLALGLVLITAMALVLVAGKVYRVLILYKGKTLKPSDLIGILRSRS